MSLLYDILDMRKQLHKLNFSFVYKRLDRNFCPHMDLNKVTCIHWKHPLNIYFHKARYYDEIHHCTDTQQCHEYRGIRHKDHNSLIDMDLNGIHKF